MKTNSSHQVYYSLDVPVNYISVVSTCCSAHHVTILLLGFQTQICWKWRDFPKITLNYISLLHIPEVDWTQQRDADPNSIFFHAPFQKEPNFKRSCCGVFHFILVKNTVIISFLHPFLKRRDDGMQYRAQLLLGSDSHIQRHCKQPALDAGIGIWLQLPQLCENWKPCKCHLREMSCPAAPPSRFCHRTHWGRSGQQLPNILLFSRVWKSGTRVQKIAWIEKICPICQELHVIKPTT